MIAQLYNRSSLAWVVIAGAAAFSMSTLFSSMKPLLVTRFAEEVGFASSLNGLIAAMPFIGIAISSLLVNSLLRLFSYQQMLLFCSLLLVVSELLNSLFFSLLYAVLVLQFLSGISVGLLMGVSAKAISTSDQPHQIFGIVDMVGVMLMSFMVAGAGLAVETNGLQGVFLFAAVLSLFYMLLMVPYKPPLATFDHQQNNRLHITLLPVLVILMGVLFVTFSGLGFTHMFNKAIALGMSYESAGNAIGMILFLSALACPIGGIVSARYGVTLPLLLAFSVCGISWYFALNASTESQFLFCLAPAVLALQFSFPILLGMSGELDSEGKWAAIATPILTSGFAWAAVSAGIIFQLGGLALVAQASVLGMLVCGLLLFVIDRVRSRVN